MKIIEKNFDVQTGKETVTEREMTVAELAEWEANQAEITAREEENLATQTAKQALLDRLGITADEAKLLLS